MNKEKELVKQMAKAYPDSDPVIIRAHGRLEIVGNHTDHNNGLCLVGATNLGIFGALGKTYDGRIEIKSEGFPAIKITDEDTVYNPADRGTSLAIVKGVLDGFRRNGYRTGGFMLHVYSTIFDGAGVSSSAAYESLICKALNYLYNDDRVSPLMMAKISQYAEREYFGKPCGMLDQIGACYGGVCYLDFKKGDPKIQPIPFNLPLKVVIVNTGGSHANLTPYYASIPQEMKHVAQHFEKECLREVPQEMFYRAMEKPLEGYSPREIKRAQHFYDECLRVKTAAKAVKEKEVDLFLEQIKLSQISSQDYLENTQVDDHYAGSPQEAVDFANTIIKHGACRIMGGGFAGSIIAFVSPRECRKFKAEMAKKYGVEKVAEVSIPDCGPSIEDEEDED